MTVVRVFLLFSTVVIYVMTIIALIYHGFDWPAVAVHDLLALDWRSQFNTDFIIYLLIVGTWVSWREGFSTRGHLLGFVSVVMGGMFSFPYILYATYKAKGDPKRILLGVHA